MAKCPNCDEYELEERAATNRCLNCGYLEARAALPMPNMSRVRLAVNNGKFIASRDTILTIGVNQGLVEVNKRLDAVIKRAKQ